MLRRPNRPGSLVLGGQAGDRRLSGAGELASGLEELLFDMENICRALAGRNYGPVTQS